METSRPDISTSMFNTVCPWRDYGKVEGAWLDDLSERLLSFGCEKMLSDGCNKLMACKIRQ